MKLHSGRQEVYEFKTKVESDKAFENTILMED